MTDITSHLVPEQSKFHRAMAAAWGFLLAMESTGFDYTLDRIERLEQEVGRLKEELRLSRDGTVKPNSCGSSVNAQNAL